LVTKIVTIMNKKL